MTTCLVCETECVGDGDVCEVCWDTKSRVWVFGEGKYAFGGTAAEFVEFGRVEPDPPRRWAPGGDQVGDTADVARERLARFREAHRIATCPGCGVMFRGPEYTCSMCSHVGWEFS